MQPIDCHRMLPLIFASLFSIANLWCRFTYYVTNRTASQSSNSFPNKFIIIKYDMWCAIKLILTFVQLLSIKLNPLSASALDMTHF